MRRLYYLTDSEQLAAQVARQLQSIPGCARWRVQALSCDGGGHFREVLHGQASAMPQRCGPIERWLVRFMLRLHAKSARRHALDGRSDDQQRFFVVVFVRKQDEPRVRNVMSHLPICPLGPSSRRVFRPAVAQGAV